MSAAVATPKKAACAKPKEAGSAPQIHRDDCRSRRQSEGAWWFVAILKYIVNNFNVGEDERFVHQNLTMALKAGVKNGALKQSKGSGASGSFRLSDNAAPKKGVAKKVAKKVKTPKKAAKKVMTPKKAAKKPKNPAKAKKPKTATKAKKPAAVNAKKAKKAAGKLKKTATKKA